MNTILICWGVQIRICTVKMEVCIPYLGYAPCNSRGMYFIPQSLQGAYPRYGIHTSVFAVCTVMMPLSRSVHEIKFSVWGHLVDVQGQITEKLCQGV